MWMTSVSGTIDGELYAEHLQRIYAAVKKKKNQQKKNSVSISQWTKSCVQSPH